MFDNLVPILPKIIILKSTRKYKQGIGNYMRTVRLYSITYINARPYITDRSVFKVVFVGEGVW